MILKPIEGFTSHIEKSPEMVVALHGVQGSGKTRFLATAPGPIGVIPLDRKTRYTVAKTMQEWGRTDVIMPEKDFIRQDNPLAIAVMNPEQAKAYYRKHISDIMRAAYRLLESREIKTIGIDSFSQFWENVLFAHFGRSNRIMPRDRGGPNQDVIDFLNAMSGKNLVLTHKSQEIWVGDGDSAKPSGKFKHAGFPNIGYHVAVQIELKKNIYWDERNGAGGGKPWKYSCDVIDCQPRPELEGPQGKDLLTDDSINFSNVMSLIYPDVEMPLIP